MSANTASADATHQSAAAAWLCVGKDLSASADATHQSAATEHAYDAARQSLIYLLSASSDAAIPLESPTASQHSVAKNLGPFNQGNASSHDKQNVATEHVKIWQYRITEEIPDILLTVDEAREIRRNFQGQIRVLTRKHERSLRKLRPKHRRMVQL